MATSTTTTKTGKTAYSTPSDREIAATRTFDAPRKLVWQAHTDPRHIPHWMTGLEGYTMPVCEIDLRPGGSWHFVWRNPDATTMEMHDVYKEVTPVERLVNTESWGGEWPETINTLVLTEKGGKTTLVSTVRYPSKEAREVALKTGMKEGWAGAYDNLDEYLRTMG